MRLLVVCVVLLGGVWATMATGRKDYRPGYVAEDFEPKNSMDIGKPGWHRPSMGKRDAEEQPALVRGRPDIRRPGFVASDDQPEKRDAEECRWKLCGTGKGKGGGKREAVAAVEERPVKREATQIRDPCPLHMSTTECRRHGLGIYGKREAAAAVAEILPTRAPYKRSAEESPVKRMAETCCWTMHGFKCSGCGGKRDVEDRPVKREAALGPGEPCRNDGTAPCIN